MNNEERQNAIKIMDKLMEHPITRLFHNFEKVDGFDSPKSFSLSTIKARLQDCDILNTNEWIDQVESCWSNDTNFQEKDKKYYITILTECKRIFKKLTDKINLNSLDKWCSNVYHIHSTQLAFARKPPRKFFSIVSQLDSFNQIDNEKIIPLSNAEIKAFIQANDMIKSEKIKVGLVEILTEFQPEFKASNAPELWIDLTKLDVRTIRALREYLTIELEKQGDHYPECK